MPSKNNHPCIHVTAGLHRDGGYRGLSEESVHLDSTQKFSERVELHGNCICIIQLNLSVMKHIQPA